MSKEINKFLEQLAQRFTDESDLRALGIELEVQDHVVTAAIRRHAKDEGIPLATSDVLGKWKKKAALEGASLVEKLHTVLRKINLVCYFIEAYEHAYGKPYESRPQKRKISQAGSSVEVRAPPEKAKNVEYSSEEESEDLPSDDETDSSIPAGFPPDGGRSLRDLLKKKIEKQKEFYTFREKEGKAVIISNDFRNNKKKFLEGYQKDVKTIKEVAKAIGLQCDKPYVNKSRKEILEILKNKAEEVAEEDYSYVCCFFLLHGKADSIKAADEWVTISDLTNCFRIDQLKGIPKLFFFQACRGSERDELSMPADGSIDAEAIISLEADIFEFYAAPLSYVSWVHPTHGSTFMQCLCHVLKEVKRCNRLDKADIHEIATNTNNMISKVIAEAYKKQTREEKKKNAPKEHRNYLQVSVANSTLTKNFRFKE